MTPEKRADITERYGWAEGEREQVTAELAERAQRIARDEALAWCKQRNAERREQERAAAQQPPEREATMSNANTEGWQNWISGEIRKQQKAREEPLLGGIADAIGEYVKELRDEIATEREARQKDSVEISVLRQELHTLRNELSELKGEIKTRSALDEMTARLDRIEERTARSSLRTVGSALSA